MNAAAYADTIRTRSREALALATGAEAVHFIQLQKIMFVA